MVEHNDCDKQRSLSSPVRRISLLTRVLRASGAAVVVAAAGTFLFQHWERGNDLTRYFTLLAQSGVLSAIGLFCAVQIRESKGARTFMALAVGIVPALFCILGGLVYSQFSWDGATGDVARYAKWVAPGPIQALATVAATLVVVTLIGFLSMLSLVRTKARPLTAVFLVANAALLIPTRAPEAMAALLAILLAAIATLEWKHWSREPAMRTGEGWIVRAMLALPLAMLVLRSVLHYELSLFMVAVACLAASSLFFLCAYGWAKERFAALCEFAAVVFAALGWGSFAIAAHLAFALPSATFLPMGAFPMAGTFLGMSLVQARHASTYRNAAVAVALAAVAGSLFLAPSVLASFLALAVGILAAGYGFFFERNALLLCGALTALAGLLRHVAQAIELYGHWTSLSALGISVILAASLLERHHEAIGNRVRALRERARNYRMA